MRIRYLIAFLLVVGLGATGAMAASYTVYPTVETNGTGTTTYDAKTGGTVMAWGGATTGTVRKEAGYLKFDVASVPDVTVPTKVEFHFYVSATNYPWYSTTPLSIDPNAFSSSAAMVWDDVTAEAAVGYYNYQNEGSTYAPGWKMLELGGTALTDITAAFAQDWFAVGMVGRDTTATFFVTVDGNTDTNIPYLVVSDDPLYEPPTGLTCALNGVDVDLTWVNGPSPYDSIEIYEDGILIDTVLGTDVAYTVVAPVYGMQHCYEVCGIVSAIPYCSDECCLFLGTCEDATVDLGNLDCPGTLTASGDTTGAADFCGNLAGDNFYSFTTTTGGGFTITLCSAGTSYDTYLRLYDDACCGNEIAFDDDDPLCTTSTLQSTIEFVALVPGTYYVQVEGYSAGEGTYDLDISCVTVIQPPSGLLCEAVGSTAALNWTNNDTYDSIEVYQDDVLVATLGGSATTIIVDPVEKGYHCYYVCGVVGVESFCSDNCCMIQGYDNEDLLWDFEADDGGFVTDGTSGWQWGAPTYGPCFDTADGNVWATNLDGDYTNNACYLLDSPEIEMGDKGGYLCIDHCYDTEFSFDGGTVWFTTDGGLTYANLEPLEGYDDDALVATGCTWAAGAPGFSGDSLGWVTDCWELIGADYADGTVAMRLAFGSDTSVATYSGWMIDNITVYRNLMGGTIDCDYTITPLVGEVPFSTTHRITMANVLTGGAVYTRRVSGRIAVTIASGNLFNPWRAGYTNIAPGDIYFSGFPVAIPALASVIGNNTFVLSAEDVTPAPYNQPPYPPSGDTCTKTNVVVANAP